MQGDAQLTVELIFGQTEIALIQLAGLAPVVGGRAVFLMNALDEAEELHTVGGLIGILIIAGQGGETGDADGLSLDGGNAAHQFLGLPPGQHRAQRDLGVHRDDDGLGGIERLERVIEPLRGLSIAGPCGDLPDTADAVPAVHKQRSNGIHELASSSINII